MKILAIGDFHGEFPSSIPKIIKKEKIDFVISNGDFFPFWYRKFWFEHCYGKNVELWQVIGKDKTKEWVKKDLVAGEKTIRLLNKLPVPVYTVAGNLDYINYADTFDPKPQKNHWKWYDQDFFSGIIKKYKNIHRFDYKTFILGNYILIGAYGHTFPGKVKSVNYLKHKVILDSLFSRHKDKQIIFVSHNVPYKTRLDKIGMHAHIKVRGKHYGSKLVRRIIDRWQPIVHIGGHIHEGRGIQKLGKTVCVNPGAVHEHQGSIIEIMDKKVRVRLIKL